jgi:hypothetical protein
MGMSSGDGVSAQTPTLHQDPIGMPDEGQPDVGSVEPTTISKPTSKPSNSSGGGDLNLKQ